MDKEHDIRQELGLASPLSDAASGSASDARDRRSDVNPHRNAGWWSEASDTSWNKVKEALRRDWQQTRHDLGGDAPDIGQDLPDTLRQAAGRKPIPPAGVPNADEADAALRFGHGARGRYLAQHPVWSDSLEDALRTDWVSAGNASDWQRHREAVRYGYEYHPMF